MPAAFPYRASSAVPVSGWRFGIERILDDKSHGIARSPRAHGDFAALHQRGDPMLDGVLDQRLHHERRDFALAATRLDVLHHAQPLAEAHLLHVKIGPGQRQFFAEENGAAVSQPQRRAQKIREPDRHVPRFRRINCGERADGMQAVEQKMRIDLRLQGFQFGLARQHLGFA